MIQLSILRDIMDYMGQMQLLELAGLIFGLLCVYFLIKENILTWICGIIYVLISFVVFWQSNLYGDFLLHVFFLVLNIYGWYSWVRGNQIADEGEMPVTQLSLKDHGYFICLSVLGVVLFAQFLIHGSSWVDGMAPASLPYWDSTTSILSVTGMWLTAQKKLDNWYYWLVVDILATGIYFYKELYFYSLLYFIYIFFAIAGYLAWRKSMASTTT